MTITGKRLDSRAVNLGGGKFLFSCQCRPNASGFRVSFTSRLALGMGGAMPTVFVIEDSKLLRAMIQRLLGKAGYSVVSAAGGEEGLRIVRDQKPDLVLLDMLLPKLGGEEVLRHLKLDAETAGVPVVVLTSLS
jgi:PleD family two-component response regulator